MTEPIRILTVCTHNRTRSVMMAALLQSLLDQRLGTGRLEVSSSGFASEGWPAIDQAVAAMARRGLDISSHRSRTTTVDLVEAAELIVTAERDHVVRVASLSPRAFARAMTLPELLALSSTTAAPDAPGVEPWVASLTAGRTASAYLRDPVREVPDPTGTGGRAFEHAVVEIERQCTEVTVLVAAAVSRA